MSTFRQYRCAGVALAGLALGTVAFWLFCGSAAAQEPKRIYDGTPLDPALDPPQIDMPPKWEDSKRDKMVAEFERRLGRLKPAGKNKTKDLEDYYLIATGDINTLVRSADVRFLVLQGQRKTAEFLVDYVAAAPEGVVRKWHVFARFKEAAEAQQGLAAARLQYDQMVAYRKKLEEIYRVASTRRC